MGGSIEIFQSSDNQIEVSVKMDSDTVWLTKKQMALLFGRDRTVISRHINNIFKEGEVDKEVGCAFFAHTTQHGAIKDKMQTSQIEFYNLDVIISVGYRVKSLEGVHFRRWATSKLKELLIEGYVINEKRLEQKNQEIQHLKNGIRILHRAIELEIDTKENKTLSLYSKGLSILDDYDHEELDRSGTTNRATNYPTTEEYLTLIKRMYSDFESEVFAKPKDNSFDSSVNQIRQSFGDEELYPSLEEKAATLLYLIVKNHSFVDGNKRIGAACFLHFLERNNLLKNADGELILSNEALASLTLFIANSKSEEMETVKRLTMTILNRRDKNMVVEEGE